MSREKLQKKTCKELRELAKERNISGRWDMVKEQLIEAILEAEEVSIPKKKSKRKPISAKDENKVDNQTNNVEVEDKDENKSANIEVDMKLKMPYIENVEIGALIAFRLSTGKVKSAKVIRKSVKNHKLKLQTEYGAEYIISFDDVIWVRTGKRWPQGVYKLLKGLTDESEKGE